MAADDQTYKPYGHLQWLPQWLRMALLGEGPVFHLLERMDRWNKLTDEQREAVRARHPKEIEDRRRTLDDNKYFAAALLAALAFLAGELGFALATKPKGAALWLTLTFSVLHAIGIVVLTRAIVPAPHALVTDFEDPIEWALGERGRLWTNSDSEDELFVAKDLHQLLDLNALVQFTKRCLLVAALFTDVGHLTFVGFVFAQFA